LKRRKLNNIPPIKNSYLLNLHSRLMRIILNPSKINKITNIGVEADRKVGVNLMKLRKIK
jgi:ribosomal protein S10